jgi:hypothetical protein
MSKDYYEKNLNRKRGKENGTTKERTEAKKLRKLVNGKFGEEDESFQRNALLGTVGEVSPKAGSYKSRNKEKK